MDERFIMPTAPAALALFLLQPSFPLQAQSPRTLDIQHNSPKQGEELRSVQRVFGTRSIRLRPEADRELYSAADTRKTPNDQAASRVDVHFVTDEADAVLVILDRKNAGRDASEEEWGRLFSSQGYQRLKKREVSLKRAFTDEGFRDFVLSDELAKRAASLADTLARWKRADITGAAGRVLSYLPSTARISAKIYPVIKPSTNSFVFETDTDPAIFLYLDPAMTAMQFENTLAHELHHIGLSASCLSYYESQEFKKLPDNVRQVVQWISAFGEGAAMLAAAGGPDVHPHASSSTEDRARWDRDVANFNSDLPQVEKFFLDMLDGRLRGEEEIRKRGMEFFGVQGPWYTVGWKMAVTIERTNGREKLIECFCDPAQLLITFNRAAAEINAKLPGALATWPPALVEVLRRATTLRP